MPTRLLAVLPLVTATTALLAAAASAQALYEHKTKQGLIKTSAPREAAREFGRKIDYYVELFDAFYEPLGLRRKNNNRIIVRLMPTYEEFERFWKKGHSGNPPAAFFSRSLNAIVLYNDPESPWLRQTLFHEASHQYLNRYTYAAPKWFNEGLAEYFEGWWIQPGQEPVRRPALFDLIVVQEAIRSRRYLSPEQLVGLSNREFADFKKEFPEYHHYLHYSTAWSVTYYCLEGPNAADRQLWMDFVRDVNRKGERAVFAPEDWEEFEDRWREFVLALPAERKDADDYLLVAQAYRQNGDYGKAVLEYRKALRKYPEVRPKAIVWLGYCYRRAANYRMATKYLTEALELVPTEARAPYNLARIAVRNGLDESTEEELAEALDYAEAAARLSPTPTYLSFLAKVQAGAGDHKAAVKTMRKLIRSVDRDEREAYEELLKEVLAKRRKKKGL